MVGDEQCRNDDASVTKAPREVPCGNGILRRGYQKLESKELGGASVARRPSNQILDGGHAAEGTEGQTWMGAKGQVSVGDMLISCEARHEVRGTYERSLDTPGKPTRAQRYRCTDR